MVTQREIKQQSEKYYVTPAIIDKDWVLGHLLNAIYSFENIKSCFVFKGGTCLKKCYFEDYRFSEDLDFTLLDISYSEILFNKHVFRKIIHPFSDSDLINETIPVYPMVEIVAEKLRSLIQRNRPRDIYDKYVYELMENELNKI